MNPAVIVVNPTKGSLGSELAVVRIRVRDDNREENESCRGYRHNPMSLSNICKESFRRTQITITPASLRDETVQIIVRIFSQDSIRPRQVLFKGITFTPEHKLLIEQLVQLNPAEVKLYRCRGISVVLEYLPLENSQNIPGCPYDVQEPTHSREEYELKILRGPVKQLWEHFQSNWKKNSCFCENAISIVRTFPRRPALSFIQSPTVDVQINKLARAVRSYSRFSFCSGTLSPLAFTRLVNYILPTRCYRSLLGNDNLLFQIVMRNPLDQDC